MVIYRMSIFNIMLHGGNEYIEFLNSKFAELEIGKYAKNMENIFDVLLEHGNPKFATTKSWLIVIRLL